MEDVESGKALLLDNGKKCIQLQTDLGELYPKVTRSAVAQHCNSKNGHELHINTRAERHAILSWINVNTRI